MTVKKRTTDSYTAPAPKRKANKRGGKRRRDAYPTINLAVGKPVTLGDTYTPTAEDIADGDD